MCCEQPIISNAVIHIMPLAGCFQVALADICPHMQYLMLLVAMHAAHKLLTGVPVWHAHFRVVA